MNRSLKIAIVDTYYPKFLESFQRDSDSIGGLNYDQLRRKLLLKRFGTSDAYSHNLKKLGVESCEIIPNFKVLSTLWRVENNLKTFGISSPLLRRLCKINFFSNYLSIINSEYQILKQQLSVEKYDVLYCQDISYLPPSVIKSLKRNVRLVVGQIASPLPSPSYVREYDLILTSLPHFVDLLKHQGVQSEYFRIGFDERLLTELSTSHRDISFSFVGGLTWHHQRSVRLLEELASSTAISIFGYGFETLPASSPIAERYQGQVWGRDMFEVLGRSLITLNRHSDISQNYANNMRLFEATGMGSMLLTDHKSNLNEFFNVGTEVETYTSPGEAVEKAIYYLENPQKAAEIAKSGQARTLSEHTYSHRMLELVQILKKYV